MRQNRRAILGLIVFVLLMMAITLVASRRLQVRIEAGEDKIVSLQEETEKEENRTEEIRAMQEYMQSDEYKEQIAKERLGLIRDGEIIFKEADAD